MELPAYFTTAEVAARYRKPLSTVRYWRHIGYGPKGTRVGSSVLYPVAEVERFDRELAEQASAGGAARARTTARARQRRGSGMGKGLASRLVRSVRERRDRLRTRSPRAPGGARR